LLPPANVDRSPDFSSAARWPILDAVEEFIERARAGDREALGALWRSHHHLLLRYFRGRRALAPDDLASQVWIDVATNLHRFEGDADDFRRWLFTIAHRRYVDGIRRSTRRRAIDQNVIAFHADGDGVDLADPDADDAFDAGDSLDRALALVRTLPPDQAEAVLLRIVADLSVTEVAMIMGRREGHVRVLTHRGIERLRRTISDGAVTEAPRQAIRGVT
jgi:RNA polymerase sigma-70 factor, ECF subfamily